MPAPPRRRRTSAASPLALAFAMLAATATAPAQRLPVQVFGLREGLANPHVTCLLEDKKGYLWVGTWEGLSRCDGRRFVNYGPAEGLPTGIVNALREDRQGRVWVATNGGGVARLRDRPGPDATKDRFVVHEVAAPREANVVEDLLITDEGVLYCVTEAGLYRGTTLPDGGCSFTAIALDPARNMSGFLFRGGDGTVWVALADAVARIGPGGLERTAWPGRGSREPPTALLEERDGTCLVAFGTALCRVVPGRSGAAPSVETVGPPAEATVRAMARGAHGELLLATDRGLVARAETATTTTRKNGLPDDLISSVLVTGDKSLWLGTDHGGLVRVTPVPITSYTCGAGTPNLHRVVLGPDGRVYATSVGEGIFVVDGGELVLLEGSESPPFANVDMRLCCDTRGDFWIGTDRGMHLAKGPRLDVRQARRLGAAEGVPESKVFGEICAGGDGRVWYGTNDAELVGIDASDPAHLRVERKVLPESAATRHARALLPAPDGGLWVAPFVGLWRLRGDAFTELGPADGLPGPYVYPRSLFVDRRGRLWIGTRFAGVSMCDSPERASPVFRQWSTREGLASDAVWAIAEDDDGTIYLGTGRGLDALDVANGTIRHLGSAEGLAGSVAFHIVRDGRGRIWVGANGGVSCLDPKRAAPLPPPPRIYVTRLVAGGTDVRLPETGAEQVTGLVLPPDHADLWLEATVVSAETTRFQHRLLGHDADWSEPSDQAMVRFGRLAPGSYCLLVRALLGDGRASERPAAIAFVVLAPIWARWWFLLGSACVLAGIALAFHRARLARALALERLRTEIATDLHDDLGSGLAQIAIQSEVGRRAAGTEQEHAFGEIARLARGLRESIADIVWAVDASRDRLLEVVRRARHVAFNLLDSDGLEVAFTAPEDERTLALELPAALRRHLLLFVKEAVTNVARHARARSVAIEITLSGAELGVRISDDGCGFDTARVGSGHGLTSLSRRARALGAELSLRSEPGAGTEIRLRVPLAGRNRIDMRVPAKPTIG